LSEQLVRVFSSWEHRLQQDLSGFEKRCLANSTLCASAWDGVTEKRFADAEEQLTAELRLIAEQSGRKAPAEAKAQQQARSTALCNRAFVRELQEKWDEALADYREAALLLPPQRCRWFFERLKNYHDARRDYLGRAR
jgi:hypothetical protein